MEAEILEILKALMEKVDNESKEARKFRMKMEADVIPHIQLLSEGFSGYADRVPMIEQMASDISDLKLSMDVVEAIVKKQSSEITKLKAVN